MDTICSSHKSLYRDFLSMRPTRLGEPPPVSLLLWSRGGLVIEVNPIMIGSSVAISSFCFLVKTTKNPQSGGSAAASSQAVGID